MYQFEREPSRLPLEPNEVPPFDFDPHPYPHPPPFVPGDPSKLDHVRSMLGELPAEEAGWAVAQLYVEGLFSEWKVSGYSDTVFRLWSRSLCESAARLVIGDRTHLDRSVQANFVLQHPEMCKLRVEACRIHQYRVAALEQSLGLHELSQMDRSIVQTWERLDAGRWLFEPDQAEQVTYSGRAEILPAEAIPQPDRRKVWVALKLKQWERESGEKWTIDWLAPLVGCSGSTLRHWIRGDEKRSSKTLGERLKEEFKRDGNQAYHKLKSGTKVRSNVA